MKKFKYTVELKKGYMPAPVFEAVEETEVEFVIEARNRVTADRMVKALLEAANVEEYGCVCVE